MNISKIDWCIYLWLNSFYMSGEQLSAKELNKVSVGHRLKKVDINDLLSKVRQEKIKEKKENYIFLGLICGVVAVTGIIASF